MTFGSWMIEVELLHHVVYFTLFSKVSLTVSVRTAVIWILHQLWNPAKLVTRLSMRLSLRASGLATPIPRTSLAMSGKLNFPT